VLITSLPPNAVNRHDFRQNVSSARVFRFHKVDVACRQDKYRSQSLPLKFHRKVRAIVSSLAPPKDCHCPDLCVSYHCRRWGLCLPRSKARLEDRQSGHSAVKDRPVPFAKNDVITTSDQVIAIRQYQSVLAPLAISVFVAKASASNQGRQLPDQSLRTYFDRTRFQADHYHPNTCSILRRLNADQATHARYHRLDCGSLSPHRLCR